MGLPFTDLTIGELDLKETYKRSGKWWEKVFFLSGPVPEAWARIFEEVWAGADYVPKRHARIENGRLATICLHEEIRGVHMQFLHAAVERTNVAYRKVLAESADISLEL
jgi:hypothetical protein